MKTLKTIFLSITLLMIHMNTWASGCPNSIRDRIVQVSPEEMMRVQDKLSSEPGVKRYVAPRKNHTVPHINISNAFSSSSDESALVIFAIIGVLVVALWIPYTVAYAYDAISGGKSFCPWYRFEYGYKTITSSSSSLDVKRDGYYQYIGVSIASMQEKYSLLGLALKLGNHNIEDTANGVTQKHKGEYFLVGPKLIFGNHSFFNLSMNLLGGTSNNSSVGFMSEASFEFSFAMDTGRSWMPVFSFSVGADYAELDFDREGVIEEPSKYSLFGSFGIGLQY